MLFSIIGGVVRRLLALLPVVEGAEGGFAVATRLIELIGAIGNAGIQVSATTATTTTTTTTTTTIL